MLQPEYIEKLPDNLVELYSKAEQDIIADMVRRIITYDFFIPAAEFQFRKLQDMGLLYDEIIKRLSTAAQISEKDIKALIQEAGAEALKVDDSIYRKAGMNPTPLDADIALQNVLAAGIDKTKGLFKNLTKTTANTASKQFENALDRAYMQITTGAFDYNSAIRSVIKDLASKGVAVIQYPSKAPGIPGHTDYMEVAVRRATVTGVNQTAAKLQEARADEMGSDLVETTAHAGAREDHQIWQGKVFSRSGTHLKYPDFVQSTGYGTGAGLCGWNCRHSFFPYIEGVSDPTYTKAELNDMNAKDYTYNGLAMDEYEATQKQRYIERQIRRWKREYVTMEAANLPTAEAASKVASWRRIHDDFIKQTGLKPQTDRHNIGGFGRSQARKASAAAKEIEKYSKIRYNEDGTIKVTDDWRNRGHQSTPPRYKTNAVVDTLSQKGKQRDRTIYGEDQRMKRQIHGGDHGRPKLHPYGKCGEHAHDYTWDGETSIKTTREISDLERRENADIMKGDE